MGFKDLLISAKTLALCKQEKMTLAKPFLIHFAFAYSSGNGITRLNGVDWDHPDLQL